MRGHDALIAMRRARKKPAYAWVSDFHNAYIDDGFTVCVAGDLPELLDLSFLVGVTVIVEGPTNPRNERIAKACLDAGARRVLSSTHQPDQRGLDEVVRVTDTQGVLSWPK